MAFPETAPAQSLFPIGFWQARLTLTSAGKVEVDYFNPLGAAHARLPSKDEFATIHATSIAALKAMVADIDGALREARFRLEQCLRNGRSWTYEDWQARYQNHPMTRTMAARLLWQFSNAQGDTVIGLGTAPTPVGLDGLPISLLSGTCTVRLWHPVMSDHVTRQAWRLAFMEQGLRQPFFQLWRSVYEVTQPELNTATYSNRFAGLTLEQPVFVNILRKRGWDLKSRMMGVMGDLGKPARLALPAWGLVAEYWGDGVGAVQENHEYGAPNLSHFASSQIRFYRAGEDSQHGAASVALVDVPEQAFCEAMFDVDMVTGIAAVGLTNNWQDPGPNSLPPMPLHMDFNLLGTRSWQDPVVDATWNGNLTQMRISELAKLRTELLAWLVPRLKIAPLLKLEGHFLCVQGKWHNYEIHTANAAVNVVKHRRHICIVLGHGSGALDPITLPFAGDDVLALVLSKAHMLVDEDKIKDQTIIAQLRPA